MWAERGAYSLSVAAALFLVFYTVVLRDDVWIWNALSLLSLAVTGFGAAVAVTIFRVQAKKAVDDQNAQELLLKNIGVASMEAASNSAAAASGVESMKDFLEAMEPATRAAAEPGPESDVGESSPDSASEEPEVSASDESDVIFVRSIGEYRRASAVPLKLLADLVQWWKGPGNGTGSWLVGNLIGSFRPYNKRGTLQGVPWILTFRRSDGSQVDYRVSYSGRARKGEQTSSPTVSEYSKGEARWLDGEPLTGMAD